MKTFTLLILYLYLSNLYANEKYNDIEKFLLDSNNLHYSKNTYNQKKDFTNKINTSSFIFATNKSIIKKNRNYNFYLSKKNQTLNFDVKTNLELLDYLNVDSKAHFEFTKNNYFANFGYKKSWKNYYNFDYSLGQNFGKSVYKKFDCKYFMRIDKKLNDKYFFQNYYEYVNQGKNSINSIISLKKQFNNFESLIYKIILKNNEEYSSYGVKIGYKISNFIL